MATYTAVLISDTAVPAWHGGHREMPFLFAGSAAATAAGAALMAGSACLRFGVFHAGIASTEDPRYTVVPQREGLSSNAHRDPGGSARRRDLARPVGDGLGADDVYVARCEVLRFTRSGTQPLVPGLCRNKPRGDGPGAGGGVARTGTMASPVRAW